MNKTIVLLIFLLISKIAMAANGDSYWSCVTQDAEKQQWVVSSSYKITALNKSYEQCKKGSKSPKSCKTLKRSCELFVGGVSTRSMWRCTALDFRAVPWTSTVSADISEAALAAKASCREGSTLPETCYINLITCQNLTSEEVQYKTFFP